MARVGTVKVIKSPARKFQGSDKFAKLDQRL